MNVFGHRIFGSEIDRVPKWLNFSSWLGSNPWNKIMKVFCIITFFKIFFLIKSHHKFSNKKIQRYDAKTFQFST
jgi:hypothetical protein